MYKGRYIYQRKSRAARYKLPLFVRAETVTWTFYDLIDSAGRFVVRLSYDELLQFYRVRHIPTVE